MPELSGAWPPAVTFDGTGRPIVSFQLVGDVSLNTPGRIARSDSLEVRVLAPDASSEHVVGRFAGVDAIHRLEDISGRMIAMITPRPFGARPAVVGLEDGVLIGRSDALEFRAYAPNGDLRRIVRVAGLEQPVDDAALAEYVAAAKIGPPSDPMVEDFVREFPPPQNRPAYRACRPLGKWADLGRRARYALRSPPAVACLR